MTNSCQLGGDVAVQRAAAFVIDLRQGAREWSTEQIPKLLGWGKAERLGLKLNRDIVETRAAQEVLNLHQRRGKPFSTAGSTGH